ncbi:disease resistance protein SUMM2-like isoform X2 [Vicia villosa]|uniref:disease resistance protein SUMM2-like isoform X2 n=1 Tax=Vicia villosa TaxID=3911 RepID=UPI00273C6C3B|nr:disease resistance protein SUMM2-like isoform X2 [Vicia villosa]
MANIVMVVASNVGKYLAGPVIREVQYLLCVNNVINLLENEREALTSERDSLLTRVAQAKERTEVIENPVEKWLNDVENLLEEVEILVRRTETDLNCFQGWFPTCSRYLLCKEMVKKIEAMEKFKGKSNDINPFSHLAPLPGIQYQSSEDFIYFESTKMAYSQIWEALEDDRVSIIGVHGEGGCGKTALVTEVGKKAEELDMFDKVISITVSRTPNIRGIQGKIADMLNVRLGEESEEGRAQRLWLCLQEKKRVLIIVDDIWRGFHLMDIGILLDSVNKRTWKILITTHSELICTSMECQKTTHLELLSEDESWTFFQKFVRVDNIHSKNLPLEICNECERLPLTIKTVALSLKGRDESEWHQTLEKLRDSKESNDEGGVTATFSCLKLCFGYLLRPETKQLFLMCSLFPEDYHIPIEDLLRYTVGLRAEERLSLSSRRSLFEADISQLLDSGLLMRGSVKMHDVVRDAALWYANRSKNCKIMVNVDKPLSIVAGDNKIRDCFAVSSWWYNESPSFCQLHDPNLKILLLNISSLGSFNSYVLLRLTFEGMQGLEVLSLTINYKRVRLSLPPSIQLLRNVRTLRLNGLEFGDLFFIPSLIRLEILDLRRCKFNELPIEIGKLLSLRLLDLSECHIFRSYYYNGAIGKCLQLEELYASACYPEEYVSEISMDISILPNLQRFKFSDQITLKLKDCNISNLRTTEKTILQIGKYVSLTGLHGGCKNIIPDMVGIVGGMKDLTSLLLKRCKEIKCIVDATYDFKEDDLIPNLAELRLQRLENFTVLCRGPPLEVLRYFEKLELLDIQFCKQLYVIFPMECKLRNLKILRLQYCWTDGVLFSASVAQSLQQLEELSIIDCNELKHIISASGSEHDDGFNTREEIIPIPTSSPFLMTNLREVNIVGCRSLESIFPICYVEGLNQLQMLEILSSPKLKYVFDEYGHEHLSSHQYKNQVMLPRLESLTLDNLNNFIGMCPENCQANWPSQTLRIMDINNCPRVDLLRLNLQVGYDKRRRNHLNEIWSFQCLQHLTVGNNEKLKYLFFMKTHRSLPELIELSVYDCQELEQIFAASEELVQLPRAKVYFPKLKDIYVDNCNKLKNLFPLAMVRMLPQLSVLNITNCTGVEEVFRHGPGGDNIIRKFEVVIPYLACIILDDLPNFIDICHGYKLPDIELLQLCISNCPKIVPSLKKVQDETQ